MDMASDGSLRRIQKYCDELERIGREVIESESCFSLKDLAVKGNDIMALGIPAGKQVGEMLNLLLDAVIAGDVANDKEDLIFFAKKLNL